MTEQQAQTLIDNSQQIVDLIQVMKTWLVMGTLAAGIGSGFLLLQIWSKAAIIKNILNA